MFNDHPDYTNGLYQECVGPYIIDYEYGVTNLSLARFVVVSLVDYCKDNNGAYLELINRMLDYMLGYHSREGRMWINYVNLI